MKATLETVTGITIKRDIDASDTPMSIIREFYKDDPTAAAPFFANKTAIDQLVNCHIDETKCAFELINIKGDSISVDWTTALCNQPSVKEEITRIEADGQVPTFIVEINCNCDGHFEENEHTPWLTCMALQSIFKDDGFLYSFSIRDRSYEGVFELFSANVMKLAVEKNGDVLLLWESQKLINKELRRILEDRIKGNDLGLDGNYDLTIEGDRSYTVKMVKKLEHGSDSIKFACDVACEQVFFIVDVNTLAKIIQDTWHDVSVRAISEQITSTFNSDSELKKP